MRSQPDERLTDTHLELDRDHAGGLMHNGLEIRASLQLSGELARGRVGLEDEQRLRSDVGHDECVGVLVSAERSRPVAVQVERTETDRADLEGEPEDCLYALLDSRWSKGKPTKRGGMRKVWFEYRTSFPIRIYARPFSEGVLPLLDMRAHIVGSAHRPSRHITRHQHEPGASHVSDLGTHLAEPPRFELGGTVADKPVEDPQTSFTGHRSPAPPISRLRCVRNANTVQLHLRHRLLGWLERGLRLGSVARYRRGDPKNLLGPIGRWYSDPRRQRGDVHQTSRVLDLKGLDKITPATKVEKALGTS
jgi:hypothetical protein